jgi:hypothetical protein
MSRYKISQTNNNEGKYFEFIFPANFPHHIFFGNKFNVEGREVENVYPRKSVQSNREKNMKLILLIKNK